MAILPQWREIRKLEQSTSEEVRHIYISERIVNISELESIISTAYRCADALRSEIEKESPSMDRIDELSKVLHLNLLHAKHFEFCIEHRKVAGDFSP